LCSDLDFSPENRSENIRRVSEVAAILNKAGIIPIVALISPYRKDRERARRIIGEDKFIEVHISTPLSVCEERDVKGLYKKARSGEIPGFTGVSAPYEEPLAPHISINTAEMTVQECVDIVVKYAIDKGGLI
jgi:adenylyl-sulfate kinase